MKLNNDNQKKPGTDILSILMPICIAIVIGYLLFNMTNDVPFKAAKEKTLQDIDHLQNISDDYRQGWIDALSRIDEWYHAPINATARI
jgi:hypothetical protein